MNRLLRIAIVLSSVGLPLVARAADPVLDLEAKLHAIALEAGGTLGVKVVHLIDDGNL